MILLESIVSKNFINGDKRSQEFYNSYICYLLVNVEKFLEIGAAETFIRYCGFVNGEIQNLEITKNPYFMINYKKINLLIDAIKEQRQNFASKTQDNAGAGAKRFHATNHKETDSMATGDGADSEGGSITQNFFGFMSKVVQKVSDIAGDNFKDYKEEPYLMKATSQQVPRTNPETMNRER